MARNPSVPKPSKSLSKTEKQAAVTRLESRIKELRDLPILKLTSGHDPAVTDLAGRIRSTLANIFGQGSAEYDRLEIAAEIDATTYGMWESLPQDIREGIDRGRNRAISTLQGEVDALKEDIAFSAQQGAAPTTASPPKASVTNEIFIVHGRDDAAKIEVARLVERAGLQAVKIGLLGDPSLIAEVVNAHIVIDQYCENLVMAGGQLGGNIPGHRRVVGMPAERIEFVVRMNDSMAERMRNTMRMLDRFLD